METLASMLNRQQQLINYERMMLEGEESLEDVGGMSSEILQFSDKDFRFLYLNSEGRKWFGVDPEKLSAIKNGSLDAFFHPDTLEYELPKLKRYYKVGNSDKIYSNYQQLYHSRNQCYTICMVLTKKIRKGFLSFIFPLEKMMGNSAKIKRIIREEIFKRNHKRQYESLTSREMEVLRLLATGVNNPCIAEELFISRRTVEEHRKNINRKLEIRSLRDILEYAYAFDLV
ncbi:response regulator transcription factor [Lunatibacter salilacus]|uniref:response regulator transcription factor n=1 Tax=Lunatibacter salilacus TaxID=2483804 RepID=UPI00131CAC9D|nr:helix-turn-helix transcriptional regulator [Lunatibacter salilacus]